MKSTNALPRLGEDKSGVGSFNANRAAKRHVPTAPPIDKKRFKGKPFHYFE